MTATTQTHFGFRDVPREEKAALVGDVFRRVAPKYDLMNDAMSLGMHRLWKRELVDMLAPRAGMQILDLAGGTGDVVFRIQKSETKNQKLSDFRFPTSDIWICDINPAMLNECRARAIDKNLLEGIEFVCGNAESLPFPRGKFDACTMAFGIRNVTVIPAALREIYRVLKPGGRFLCLEFSRVSIEALAPIYDAYSFHVIPKIGQLLAKDKDAYQYLVESIRKFPDQDRFAAMLREAGFSQVTYRNLTGGVVAVHSGWKV